MQRSYADAWEILASSWGFGLDAAANYSVKGWRFSAVGRNNRLLLMPEHIF